MIKGCWFFLNNREQTPFREFTSINETTITQEGDRWYISFSCEWEKETPHPLPIIEERSVGIDLGLQKFATLAIGKDNICKEEENPRFLTTSLLRLKRLSKKAKGSKNRLKVRIKLSKLHARIKNCRQDFLQKLTTEMIKNHDIFCLEDLDIKSLIEKNTRSLSRNISDVGWRYFLHCLKYKAEEMGKHIVKADRYFASSQICSCCSSDASRVRKKS